ncbi:LuxR C-terminal-related transcriptional regulator [Microbacterium sp. AGC85]
MARDTLLRYWLRLVMGTRSGDVERIATELLGHFPDDAELLIVRACATDVLGDHHLARELLARAEAMFSHTAASQDVVATASIGQLFIADGRERAEAANGTLRSVLTRSNAGSIDDRAAMNDLLGWAQVRHPVNPGLPIEYFAAAAREVEAAGDPALRNRALGHLAFAQTWAGHFVNASKTLGRITSIEPSLPAATGFASGSTAAAAGFLQYWSGDSDAAIVEFDDVLHNSSHDSSFTAIARMMLAYATAETGDTAACRRAAIGVQDIPLEVLHGIAWPILRESAIAVLEEAVGNSDRAVRIAQRHLSIPDLPVVAVALAGVLRRSGDYATALEMLRSLRIFAEVSYVKSSMLITAAVMRRDAGDHDAAHDLCEAAIMVAAGEGVRHPFGPRETAVRRLLSEHVHHGTHFEDFIGRCLATNAAGSIADALSERERDVFRQLQTARTLPEIARDLALSINTVKTHQRSIYRKLGVSSRREAVRTTL